MKILLTVFFAALLTWTSTAQESVARQWNEVLLEAIRNDLARPTVHARNLFHISAAMYDCWAAYDEIAAPYFLGNTVGDYPFPFEGVEIPDTPEAIKAAQEEAMSYAVYRLMRHRFEFSPGEEETYELMDELMAELGYDIVFASTNYQEEGPAALGNYIADNIKLYGLADGANEESGYTNSFYLPSNPELVMNEPGNPDIEDPNRWQPLNVPEFIDQGGNPFTVTPPFLSPEWGHVVGFALDDSVKTTYERDGDIYPVYHDPGPPPLIDTIGTRENDEFYRWGFRLVSIWQSHHDPEDPTLWDISPATIGNSPSLPTTPEEFYSFYNELDGGDNSEGHDINPHTGLPYQQQLVPRSDYARILAEFWADGPDSETPPGHWFSILNYVTDNPLLEKRWKGEGEILDDLEWDVKTYFTLGGTMHDAAIAAWSVKGWYDYIRPVSAIRFMADRGQNTDPDLPSYNIAGIPLIDGLVELVDEADPLAGLGGVNVGKIKLYTWRGPDFIEEPETDVAGVGWILAENWWPYQRPTFVTPPFAGYVSGHSTYSRAAAEVMTFMTGDEYFPGGMGEFEAPMNEFLVFEDGPSMDVTLQWATYRDASDQCSLSRIWGGIHPPADDIPGRLMGIDIGNNSFIHAEEYFNAGLPSVVLASASEQIINSTMDGQSFQVNVQFDQEMNTFIEPTVVISPIALNDVLQNPTGQWIDGTNYSITWDIVNADMDIPQTEVSISNAENTEGIGMVPRSEVGLFAVDQIIPQAVEYSSNLTLITDAEVLDEYRIDIEFSEPMNVEIEPIVLLSPSDMLTTLTEEVGGEWLTSTIWRKPYVIQDGGVEVSNLEVTVVLAQDAAGNDMSEANLNVTLEVDNKNPSPDNILFSEDPLIVTENTGEQLECFVLFDEAMNTDVSPQMIWTGGTVSDLFSAPVTSEWQNPFIYHEVYDLEADAPSDFFANLTLLDAQDAVGNPMELTTLDEILFVNVNVVSIENIKNGSVAFYPNPLEQGSRLLTVSSMKPIKQWDIYDASGRQLQSTSIQAEAKNLQLDLAEFSAGIYFLRIHTADGNISERILLR